MPHKRNPVASAVVLSAAVRVPGLVSTMLTAMAQEHERGLGGWHAEWETLPEIVSLSAGALHQIAELVPKLEIDAERMRENLEASRGLIFAEAVTMALAEKIGKAGAHEIVEEACAKAREEKRQLRDIILGDGRITTHLSAAELDRLFDARKYLGMAEIFVDRVVAAGRTADEQAGHDRG
jgi:3-carboxy-cis,cis-muconate cycloisomerase